MIKEMCFERFQISINTTGNMVDDVLIGRAKIKPLYMDDDFPLAKLAIRGSDLSFLDKTGKVLATVPLDDSGLVPGCFVLGHLFAEGIGVRRDEARAASAFARACALGHGPSCAAGQK